MKPGHTHPDLKAPRVFDLWVGSVFGLTLSFERALVPSHLPTGSFFQMCFCNQSFIFGCHSLFLSTVLNSMGMLDCQEDPITFQKFL